MRRWYQYRLRTLFLATAVLALALGLGPQLWRRYRMHNALEVALSGAPTDFYASGEFLPEWAYALADLSRDGDHCAIRRGKERRVLEILLSGFEGRLCACQVEICLPNSAL